MVAAAAFGPAVPILRILDEDRARAFYVDALDAEVMFEHRFAPHMPLYLGLSLSGCEIHLSEHREDAALGARIRIRVTGLGALADALSARLPGVGTPERQPWGERDLTLTDPFSNRLTLWEPT